MLRRKNNNKAKRNVQHFNRNPLRKVTGTVIIDSGEYFNDPAMAGYEMRMEKLECGHLQRPRQDIIGETNADRRRCAKCGKEAANDR